ncbi:hypothetical protein M0804_014674 [Polistes exclamans]|nr:hypothetical protein M0804_014676 [Polistes exclamans]KAI4474784.1 hypothetical protein M0804_014674 [Polistes exclamans]
MYGRKASGKVRKVDLTDNGLEHSEREYPLSRFVKLKWRRRKTCQLILPTNKNEPEGGFSLAWLTLAWLGLACLCS